MEIQLPVVPFLHQLHMKGRKVWQIPNFSVPYPILYHWSLLSIVNGILDDSIERKNGEIPQRVACLLKKVVLEIERRISTQSEHLRTQNSVFKAREEKYQSRIKVLETLTKEVEPTKESSPKSGASNSSNNSNLAKKKCFLIDCSGSGEKVAEGKVISTNPSDTVHCHPLGPNASKVWVEVSLIGDGQVWRQISEF